MIQPKLKKCKGHGKALGSGCDRMALRRRYGLCDRCFIDWLLYTNRGKEHLEKSKLLGKKKARKRAERIEKAKIRKLKEQVTDYKKKLQTKVNEIVRLIDIGQPCLATQRHAKQMHAGHVFSRGSQPSMKYNLHNIHRQSAQSNHWQADDIKMREGLVREYGQDYLDFVVTLKATKALKFSKPQYKAFWQIACVIVNDMRRDGKTYNRQERIEMRNWVNIKLGIYHLKHSKYDTVTTN